MNTAIQELIHFIENDRMQSSYTKEQVLELLTFKLEKEKEQIENAFNQGYTQCSIEDLEPKSRERFVDAEDYYNKTFKSE